MAGVAGEGDVPEWVGGVLGLLDDVDLGVSRELAEVARPAEEGVLCGVVVGILGEKVWRGCGGVGGGVAELELLVGRETKTEGGFCSGDVEVLDVDSLPGFGCGEGWGGEDGLGVVDGVFLLEAEGCGGEGEAAVRGRPVDAGFVAPGGLGFECGVADGGGVGVVEVDVGGEAEAVAGGGSEARGVGEGVGGRDAGGEDIVVSIGIAGAISGVGEDLVAGSDGEREAFQGSEA